MSTTIYTDADGNTVEEIRDTPTGPITSRTVTSPGGDVTNIARGGAVGIQAGVVTGDVRITRR